MSENRYEFPLAQGWSNGLVLAFEGTSSSAKLNQDDFLQVKQVHGDEIYEPSYSELINGIEKEIQADGLFLSNAQICESPRGLLIKSADCIPLIYIHRVKEQVAVVHAGWRGLLQGIHLKPFKSLGFEPEDTWVWLGPSLNGDEFEVEVDMWSQFPEDVQMKFFRDHATKPTKKVFDAWKMIEVQFKELNVELLYNVEESTVSNPNFSSWRRCQKQGMTKVPQQNFSWVKFK